MAEGLSFPAVDLFIHGWDLGRAVGIEVEIPQSAITFAHTVIDPLPGEVVRSHRVFGPEVASQPHFTGTEDFVAWAGCGRADRWKRCGSGIGDFRGQAHAAAQAATDLAATNRAQECRQRPQPTSPY